MNVLAIYSRLKKKYGPQGWWPVFAPPFAKGGATPGKPFGFEQSLMYGIPYTKLKKYKTSFRDPYFEIAVGAILTQNTAWKNVAMAIVNLYKAKALTPRRLLKLSTRELQKLIRPAGYFRQKTKKLRLFAEWLVERCGGEAKRLKDCKIERLREELLERWGIGRETADSIILYALNKPIFVIDEYTRRLCRSYGIEFKDYDEYREFFEKAFLKLGYSKQKLTKIYQEYHGLIVKWGKKNKAEKI